MAEKVLENPVCDACGVDVRPQSMFCYNCGGAVSDVSVEKSVAENKSNGKNEVSDVWLRDNFSEEKGAKTEESSEKSEEEIQEVSTAPEVETDLVDKKAGIQENAKLKSAAAMRRKAKSFQAKQVEVIWEEPANSSITKLLLVVFLMTLFAICIVYLALYLR